MDKTEFLTIYGTFESLEVVRDTLPTIIAETRRNDARLIVHDSSVNGRDEKWRYLLDLNKNHDFHLILSDNMSMANARNMCFQLGNSLYSPDFICMVEDDHGFKEGMIQALIAAMRTYYGKVCPNGFRYGLFTGCGRHHVGDRHVLPDGNSYPDPSARKIRLGGVNSCFRCAPAHHWHNVLKGYDPDEYPVSNYQVAQLNFRNYNNGFTCMIVQDGTLAYHVERVGRGASSEDGGPRLWDNKYTASDPRAVFKGKTTASRD
jgi:hypothetical protein